MSDVVLADRIRSDQAQIDLLTRNVTLLVDYLMTMNCGRRGSPVPMEAQEVLAQIKNNRDRVEILQKRSGRIIDQLLQAGVEASHRQFSAEVNQGVSAFPPAEGIVKPLAPEGQPKQLPAPDVKVKRGRRRKTLVESHRRPDGQISGSADMLLYFARSKGGVLSMPEFRDYFLSIGGIPSFVKTSMYTSARKLAERGILRRVGPSEFRIVRGSAV